MTEPNEEAFICQDCGAHYLAMYLKDGICIDCREEPVTYEDMQHLRVLAREAVAIAKQLSSYVTKFPAEGGPTATDRRLDELEKEIA